MNRFAKITALAAISAISLTACGANGDKGSSSASSSKTTSTASSAAQPSDSSADAVSFKPACPGGSISGAGSSAQLNAINQVISGYKAACSSATVNYSPTGSGAGVKSFIGRQTDWAGSDSVLNADKGSLIRPSSAATPTHGTSRWLLARLPWSTTSTASKI